jgi:hypothetical protein
MSGGQSKNYSLYIDNTEAERSLSKLEKEAAKLEAQIKKIEKSGGDASKQIEKLAKTREDMDRFRKMLDNGINKSFRDLQNEARKLENLLKRATDPAAVKKLAAEWEQAKRRVLEFEANVLKIESAQKRLAEMTKGFGGKLKDAIMGSFGGNLLARFVERSIDLLKDVVASGVQIALVAEGVRNSFNRLNEPGLLKNLREATRGTVSDLKLMQTAVTAGNFQIPLETLGTLLEFASRRARDTGQSVDYLVDSMVTGLARKSPLILDNLGINIQRINEEFKKTGDFAQAAVNVINEELKKMGTAVDNHGDKVDRWAARWENFKERVGAATLDLSDYFERVFYAYTGRSEEAADLAVMKWIADETDKFRERELEANKYFRDQYNKSDAEGRERLLQIARESLAAAEAQEKDALDKGITMLASKLKVRIDIWKNYLNSLQTQTKDITTLASLNSELDILNTTLQGLEIGSQKFKDTQKRIKQIQKEIDDATGKSADEAAKKDEQKNKEILRARQRLAEQLEDLELKVHGSRLSGYEKEILESNHRYEELRAQLVKYGVDTTKLEELHAEEIIQIHQRHFQQLAQEYARTNDLTINARKQLRNKVVSGTAAAVVRNADSLANQIAQRDRNNVAAAEYRVSKASIGERLKAERELLDAQKQQELHNTELTQQERLNIEEKYRQLRFQAEIEYYSQLLNLATSFLGNILTVYQNLSANKARQEDNELARDRELNDKKKEQYKRQLDSKLISQAEYDRRVAALDAKQAEKERAIKLKQFKRDQNAAIIQANIQIAQAVLEALASAPPPVNYILAAAVAAAGAIQLLTIKNQEPPAFGLGGRTKGPRHSKNKGMPVMNPDTGQVSAYLEGDEGILKRSAMLDYRKYTVSGTPSQIASKLNAMHGGVNWESGATLAPAWLTYTPRQMNFDGISSTIGNVRRFETGGTFSTSTAAPPSPGTPTASSIDPEMKALLVANTAIMQQLSQQIAAGIYAYVPLTDIHKQEQRMDDIRGNATFRPGS